MPAAIPDGDARIAFLRGAPGESLVTRPLEKAGEKDVPLHMAEPGSAEVN